MLVPSSPQYDQSRFVRLLVAHEPQLEGLVFALVPNWADAENVLQETKIKLWEQLSNYDETKDFGAWARTIAFFEVQSYRTRTKRKKECPASQAFLEAVATESAAAAAENDARLSALQHCLAKLNDSSRDLLRRCYGGTTIKDVASQLGRSADSVYKALATIRGRLARCVESVLRKEHAP